MARVTMGQTKEYSLPGKLTLMKKKKSFLKKIKKLEKELEKKLKVKKLTRCF